MNIKTLKRPWDLRITSPLYKLLRKLHPAAGAPPDDAEIRCHASAMLQQGNWLYRLIFPRFFAKMRYELPSDVDISQYREEGTLVYVGMQIRQLEYNYFSHLFGQLGLPLARYVNGLSLRRWMVWKDFISTLTRQLEMMTHYGGIPHPTRSGKIEEIIASGDSVLFSLAPAELQEESLLFSESHQLILAAVHAQKRSTKPVYLVPLNFLWDRRPSKGGRSIIDILFGEKEYPGTLRKTVLFWRNYKRRALVQIGNPIDIKAYQLERPHAGDEELALHIRDRILEALEAERRAITGPPARPQRWFIERLMADSALEQKIAKIAVERAKSLEQLTALARRYAKEIASNINYTVIDLAERLMTWVFRNLFEDLSIDKVNLGRLKGLSAYTTLVFVPNHRSHVDYLLLSYIFYVNNMTIPHIAAGINLSFWPLGPLFRRGGAFFMRRTFGGNQLYRAVMQSYLALLLKEGYPQEFFIEGGRSRTGKLRPPRMGMLSMYVDTIIEGEMDDLIFVPVAITYDRVIEQKEYLTELEGAAKKPEQRRDILGLTKFLHRQKERNGSIYVRFGTPLSVSGAMFDLSLERPITSEKKTVIVRLLADQLCREINRNTVVTPLAITALALLLLPHRAVTANELHRRIASHFEYIAPKDIELSESLRNDPVKATEDALAYFVTGRMIQFHDDPESPFYEVPPDKRIALDYYKNTVVHYYASLALLCVVLQKHLSSGVPCRIEQVTADLQFLHELFQFEFRFNQQLTIEEHIKPPLEFLKAKNVVKVDPDGGVHFPKGAADTLDTFSGHVQNIVDAYRCALIVLRRNADRTLEERTLIKQMMEAGPTLFLIGTISRREAVTKENFAHAIAAFRELGAVSAAPPEDQLPQKSDLLSIYPHDIAILQETLERVT